MHDETQFGSNGSEQSPLILQRLSDGVLTLTLNRPDKLNALDHAMVEALHVAIDMHGHHPDVRAIVISGAGTKAFVAGADIAELRDRGRQEALQGINSELFNRIANLPMPTIAAIRGYAAALL